MTWSRSPWLPVLAALACLAPFAGKAFNVDDPLFLWTARQIVVDPVRFYDFSVNWYGWQMPMSEVSHNPPGVAYYLALVGATVGWGELPIHLALLLPAGLVAWGTFALARELASEPTLASLCCVLTPAFVVCGSNVMSDMTMLAAWIWALCFWVRGIDSRRTGPLLWAGLLATAAVLTKYFAVALVGLFACYAWTATRRAAGRWIGPASIPLLAVAGYEAWTRAVYGDGLFFGAAAYAARFGSASEVLSQAVTGFAFMGGGALTVLCFAPLLWSRRTLVVLLAGVAVILVGVLFAGELAGAPLRNGSELRWGLLIQLALFVFSGVSLLVLGATDLHRSRDAPSLLLASWVAGVYVFACFVNWSINLRTLLPLVPAAGILIGRRLALRPEGARGGPGLLPLAPALAVAVLVAAGDFAWAGSAREAAHRVASRFADHPGRIWFQGHWGFQWYMQELGHRPLDYLRPRTVPGDVVVVPTNNTNLRGVDPRTATELSAIEVPSHPWVSTMNLDLGAGAYAHIAAPLPFAFGAAGPERYQVFAVR